MSAKKIIVVFLLMVGLAQGAYASEMLNKLSNAIEENIDKGSVIGLGVLYSQSPYKKADDSVYPVPLLIVKRKHFFIDKTIVGYNVIDNEQFKVAVIGSPRFGGYHSEDSPELAGMEDRKMSFDGGARFTWDNDLFSFNLKGLTDLADEHQGQEISAFVSKDFFDGFLSPKVGVAWKSKDLTDYYYGVRDLEATATRPAYEAGSTLSYVVGLTVAVPMGDRWAWVCDGQYEWYGDEITDSPIVGESGQLIATTGIVYRY